MTAITLLEKSYGSYKIAALKAFRNRLSKELGGLEVEIKKIYNNPLDWIIVELEGEDEEAASNLLSHNYGQTCPLSELEANQTRKGKLLETGKYGYGLFIDIGIETQKRFDAFLPLHTLRRQLANDKKVSLRSLINAYGFLDYLSLEINIDSVDQVNKKVQVSLSENQLNIFRKWNKSKLDRLIICGIPRHHLKKMIIRTGHLRDIVAVERIGLLEEIIICKRGTNAPGILSEIGRLLKNAEIQLFMPSNVEQILSILEL